MPYFCICVHKHSALYGKRQHSMLIFFFAFRIKPWETKQIVVAFIATTLKTLLSVSKTNVRLSGRKFCSGNIDNLFWNIFTHIFSSQKNHVIPNRKDVVFYVLRLEYVVERVEVALFLHQVII